MEIHNLQDLGRRLSAKEVADFLGVSIATVYKKYHDLGGIRVGRKYIFYEHTFLKVLNTKISESDSAEVESMVLPGFGGSEVMERCIKPELMAPALFD